MSELPKGWRSARLCELGVLAGGLAKGKKRKGTDRLSDVPYLRVANVQRGGLDLREVKTIEATDAEAAQYALCVGDVLFNEGGDRDKLGRGCVWNGEIPGCIHQNHVFRFRPGPLVDGRFVSAYGNSEAGQRYFLGSGKQTTNLASISLCTLGDLSIPLPSLGEQRRIVAKLEALQARSRRAREALDAIPPLLEKLRQSILAAAFRGDLTREWRAQNPDVEPATELLKRIRVERRAKWEEAELAKMVAKGKAPADDRWKAKYVEPKPVDATGLPELPGGWCWATLGEVSSGVRTICYGVVQPGDDSAAEGVRLIRVCDLTGDGRTIDPSSLRSIPLAVDEEYERSRLVGGELLVSVVGTVGRTAIVTDKLAGANIARAIARVAFDTAGASEWTMYWLNSAFMWHRLNGDSREVARKTLNISQLVEMPVPVAPASEATEVLHRVGLADARRHQLGETASTARRGVAVLDASVLSTAFRGEILEPA